MKYSILTIIGLVLMLTCTAAISAQSSSNKSSENSVAKPLVAKGESRRAIIKSKPAPEYTEEARKNNVEGTVVLKMVLASSGEVTNVTVVEGLPNGLTEKAIEAARKIKFEPGVKDGRKVSMWYKIEYVFHL